MCAPGEAVNGIFFGPARMKIGPILFLLLAGVLGGFLWCMIAVDVSVRARPEIPVALMAAKPVPSAHIGRDARLGVGFCTGQAAPNLLSEQVNGNESVMAHAPLPEGGVQVFVLQCRTQPATAGAIEPSRALAERVRLEWQEGADFSRKGVADGSPQVTLQVYRLQPLSPGAARIVTADDFLNLPQRAHAGFEPIAVGGAALP